MSQKANQKVLSDRKLSESEADVLSKNWKAERASIIQHYQRIQHNQQIALEKLQEIIESSDQRMENLNEFEVKDFLYEIDDEENEISNFKIEL